MTYFPRLFRDWNNPTWQPKFFGGRLPRRLKKLFKMYDFQWMDPAAWPDRWLKRKDPSDER